MGVFRDMWPGVNCSDTDNTGGLHGRASNLVGTQDPGIIGKFNIALADEIDVL